MKKRLYKFDNLKFFLISAVVLCHFIELIPGGCGSLFYRTIYLFHMPLFVFITGYFSRFGKRRIVTRWMMPYLVFQTLYLIFDAAVIRHKSICIQYTTPYWILWYLMTMIMYQLLLPFFETDNRITQTAVIILSVAVSVMTGFDATVGYYLSLSRFFTFLPFFLMGYYARKNSATISKFLCRHAVVILFACAASFCAAVCGVLYIKRSGISAAVLYGSFSYTDAEYSPHIKLLLLFFATLIGAGIIALTPSRKLPLISDIGCNTLPVFLLHGFIVRFAKAYNIFRFRPLANVILATLLTAITVILFGNKYISQIFTTLFLDKQKNRQSGLYKKQFNRKF